MNAADEKKNDAITDEAAEWFQAMREENVPESTRARFADWLVQSPEHGAEYLGLVELWDELGAVDGERRIEVQSLIDEARADGNVSPLFGEVGESRERTAPRRWPWAAGIAAALALAAGSLWFGLHDAGTSKVYATALGEQRSFSLEDGSIIHLNTQSEIRVRFADDVRRVDLARGEALFDVAPDARRPFIVQDSNLVAQALGTRFNVYRRELGTQVTVIEGSVAVSAQEDPTASGGPGEEGSRIRALPRIELEPGEQAEVGAASRELKRSRVDVAQVTAWTERRLRFVREPVREVVAQFNRYNQTELRLADEALGDRLFTGSFDANKPESFVDALEGLVNLDVEYGQDGSLLLGLEGANTP